MGIMNSGGQEEQPGGLSPLDAGVPGGSRAAEESLPPEQARGPGKEGAPATGQGDSALVPDGAAPLSQDPRDPAIRVEAFPASLMALDNSCFSVANLQTGKTRYYLAGGEDKPKLLFFHGFNFFCELYAPILNCLAQHFRVLCADLPGHGETGPTPDEQYPVSCFLDCAWDLMRHVGWEGQKIHIAGHSMGGMLTCEAANDPRFSPLILSVSALCPAGLGIQSDKTTKVIMTPFGSFLLKFTAIAKKSCKKGMVEKSWSAIPAQIAGPMQQQFEKNLDTNAKRIMKRLAYQGRKFPWNQSQEAFKNLQALKTAGTPVTVFLTEADKYIDIPTTKEFLTANCPDVPLIVYKSLPHEIPAVIPHAITQVICEAAGVQ